jgi:hypothetical protein
LSIPSAEHDRNRYDNCHRHGCAHNRAAVLLSRCYSVESSYPVSLPSRLRDHCIRLLPYVSWEPSIHHPIESCALTTGSRGYLLWGDLLGGVTPCFSTLSTYLTPPPAVAKVSTVYISGSPIRTTSTIINVVYARNYPVSPPTGLDTSAKVGIGVGVGITGALAGITSLLLLRRWWRRRPEPSRYPTGGASPSSSSQP